MIKGTIKNDSGEPSAGATIKLNPGALRGALNNLKKTVMGGSVLNGADVSQGMFESAVVNTAADINGNFAIRVPNGKYTITISHVGNEKYTETINANKDTVELPIKLKTSVVEGKEVVVNGIYSRPKANFPGLPPRSPAIR